MNCFINLSLDNERRNVKLTGPVLAVGRVRVDMSVVEFK